MVNRCAADCKSIERLYGCPTENSPCIYGCGDGTYVNNESCDDGNQDSLDGCSKICDIEAGWNCTHNVGGSNTCTTTCGDSYHVGAEACDDGNTTGGDG